MLLPVKTPNNPIDAYTSVREMKQAQVKNIDGNPPNDPEKGT